VKPSSADLITDALEHLEVLKAHVARGAMDTQVGMDAASLRLASAVERLTHLPPLLRDAVCGDDWPAVRAMRNRIAHGYLTVDPGAVRDTVLNDLGPLEQALREMLAGLVDAR
jgi:uncharacterized protein with HEPN domain